jgi:hypothetical protein
MTHPAVGKKDSLRIDLSELLKEKERRTFWHELLFDCLAAVAFMAAMPCYIIIFGRNPSMWGLLGGLLSLCGSILVGIFFVRLARRAELRSLYLKKCMENRIVRLSEFAADLGRSEEQVRSDLVAMINGEYLGCRARIVPEINALVLDAAEFDASSLDTESWTENVKNKADRADKAGKSELSEYDRVIAELRTLNEKISDPGVSYKIECVENASAKIFAAVQENPNKLPQIRKLMSYYLPTTLKLLRSYATLERQDIQGEGISSAKESIDRVLGTLAVSFEMQLDKLFFSDIVDISTEIAVLEGMLRRDGLSEASPFKSQTSTGGCLKC